MKGFKFLKNFLLLIFLKLIIKISYFVLFKLEDWKSHKINSTVILTPMAEWLSHILDVW